MSLVRAVLIARILPPEEFGVYGIALIMTNALSAVSQVGTSEALVQRRDDPADYLDSAWTIKVVRGFLNCAVLWYFAPTIEGFFGVAGAAAVVRVVSLSFVFGALGNQGVVYFIKDLDMRKQFIYEGGGLVVDFGVSLAMAVLLRRGIALAYGYTAGMGTLCVLSYLLHFHRPRFTFERKKAFELMRFGRWIWLDNILGLLLSEGVGAIVGRLLGSTALGLYQMAQRLAHVITSEVANVLGSVTFPLYAKLQDDLPRLRTAYLSVMKLLSLLIVPLAVLGGAYAESVTRLLLGPLWGGVGPLFAVMLAAGVFLAWSLVNHSVLRAVGRPDIGLRLRLVRFAVVGALLLRGWHGDVLTVGLVVLAGLATSVPAEFFVVGRALQASVAEVANWAGIPIFTALVAVLVARAVLPPSEMVSGAWRDLFSMSLAGCGYVCGIWAWDRYGRYGIGQLISRTVQSGLGRQ